MISLIFLILLFLHGLNGYISYKTSIHPIENRCLYLNGLKFPITQRDVTELKNLFNVYPLLIIRNPNKHLTPNEFIDFLQIFDDDCDIEAIKKPDEYPNQMLQPFHQFPDCKHVAPRGNFYKNNLFGIETINVRPGNQFTFNYVWHTDLLGHPSKNPGIVTGFHILKTPSIGGDTDFISGETIYENLKPATIELLNNSRVIINRHNFAFGNKIMDYSGSCRIKDTDTKFPEHNVKIPIIYPPETEYQTHKVLFMPSFVENIVGLSIEETDKKMKYFMEKFILPHRFSIQWREGDICVFNNRCFIHSSTPARNYLELDNKERLLFQVFLPTKNILKTY